MPVEETWQLQVVQSDRLKSVQIESKSVLLFAALLLLLVLLGAILFRCLCSGLVLHAVAAGHHRITSLLHHQRQVLLLVHVPVVVQTH